jgi:predicted PhzF superfamily epimerase YddE/YHI9
MMNTSELLHTIAKDRIAGLRTIDSYQLKPVMITVTSANHSIDLNNDMWILNTKLLPTHIEEIEMISSDNVFTATPEEYDFMDEFRFRVFSDYIDIETIAETFKPYKLEFVKIIPHRSPSDS